MQKLVVIFVGNSNKRNNDFVKYVTKQLTRDSNFPFSRSIDIPIFYYKGYNKAPKIQTPILAEKLIVFILIDDNMCIEKSWEVYLKRIKGEAIVIPISFKKDQFLNNEITGNTNAIRAYEYDGTFFTEMLFIAVAHEIYRHGFNDKLTNLGKEKAVNLFLSHTKVDVIGLDIAKKIKDYISNSQMRCFFDAIDIGIGYQFDEEIENNIKQSTLIIIESDKYSSRYWCQREVICAKENKCPIIAVDVIESTVDRQFPYISNIPIVRVSENESEIESILKILSTAIVETIRYYYAKNKLKCYEENNYIITCRPPEMLDLREFINFEDGKISFNANRLVYPDPPVYTEEISMLQTMGVKVFTPVTEREIHFDNKRIGISIGDVDHAELEELGITKDTLTKLTQSILKYVFAGNGKIVYGGDYRNGGFTDDLVMESRIVKDRLKLNEKRIINYMAASSYQKDKKRNDEWRARNCNDVDVHIIQFEGDVKETDNPKEIASNLSSMRVEMIKNSDARIIAGGKISGYTGFYPGILEETLVAIDSGLPIYILGGFGGMAKIIGKVIFNNIECKELSLDWQRMNTLSLESMLKDDVEVEKRIDYKTICDKLKNYRFDNGLSSEDNKYLFETRFIDEAIELILKGLNNYFQNKEVS